MENFEKYIGHVFDNRYRIDALVGVGGMAVVYKAVDLLMRRIVAVKILRDNIAADEASVRRFINESKAVAMLSHPNIVNIYDVSVRDNVKYIVMEYIEGITLKNYMTRRGSLNLKELLSYSMQILRALDHAHKKGIVHRDIKPQNIMLLRDGVIKVMDFGIAKLPNAETVTMSDKAIGTVYYISPEQASGEAIDARSDLYSLGVLMYEMSTGRLPFDADSPVSVALMQVNDNAVPPRSINSKIPTGLEQIILRAMEKDPTVRYQSAEQMLECLEKLKENPAIVFKPKIKEKMRGFFGKKILPGKMSRSMFPVVLGVFSAFFIAFCICGVYIFSNVLTGSSIEDYETIDVENFVGATYTQELETWFNTSLYFKLESVEYKFDENTPPGQIIEQYPSPGEAKKVLAGKQYCNVTLTVSGGEETFKLDDYTAQDYRLVVSMLRSKKIKSVVTKKPSMVYEYGGVLTTVPEPGTVINAGDTVEVIVSSGLGGADVWMPDLTGKNEAEVLIEMAHNKLIVGKITYEESEDEDAGIILEQSVKEGTGIFYYTVVDFVVSLGSEDEETTETEKDTEPPKTEATENTTTDESTADESTAESDGPTSDSEADTTDPEENTTDTESLPEDSTAEPGVDPDSSENSGDPVAPSDDVDVPHDE